MKDKLYIQGLPPGAAVEIWDVMGILRMREEAADGELDMSGLPGGIYFLRVREPGALSHRKGGVWKFVRE